MAELFRAQDLTGSHSRTVKTTILVLAGFFPWLRSQDWMSTNEACSQWLEYRSLWASGRCWWLMMSSGGFCLRQSQTSAFSNQNCIVMQEFYMSVNGELLSFCNQTKALWELLYCSALLKITCIGFALDIIVMILYIIMNCYLYSLSHTDQELNEWIFWPL